MPAFFIERPVFAWVIAILITLGGIFSIFNLGVESYPSIAPPQIAVTASYPGASAETTERAVTQVIEQQLTGIDNLLYFSSSSSAAGGANITLTFESGTDPDIAQVQVQNKVSLATPRLPSEVNELGVVVAKADQSFLLVVALLSDNENVGLNQLNDIIASRLINSVARLPGVGSTQHFGTEYSMRIWLNPISLQGYGLSATEVLNAIRTQNVQFAAGAVGAEPALPGQGYTATVSAEGRFTSKEQFEDIILRANRDGSAVRLKDVARVELGPNSYGLDSRFNGKPAAGFAIQLLPGANALEVSQVVKDEMQSLAPSFPAGVSWFVPYDSTDFVDIAIEEVVQTLFEAVLLVFLVMLLFLQNFRATLIPTLIIPVALLGTFLGLSLMGFSINQLTLFGMVLAIGIVVDDAIVVIENVERIMREEKLPPKEATRKSMGQITGAVIAMSLVLAAVFIPSALQSGSVGAIYRQFALTIALATVFSAFLALSFTPALCATLIKGNHDKQKNVVFRKFNQLFDWTRSKYISQIGSAARHTPRWMVAFLAIAVLTGYLFTQMPGSFVPEEDQGYALVVVQLPPGASMQRTNAVFDDMREILQQDPAFESVFQVAGFSFVGQGENVGLAFIKLKDWGEREASAAEYIERTNGALYGGIRDASAFVVNLPTIQGLGQFGGFDMYLQDRTGQGQQALTDARNALLGEASQSPVLTGVRPNTLEPAPQIRLDVDRTQAQTLGLSVTDVYNAIQLMLAPVFVNDFFYEGRVKRVTMQADAPYRMGPESLRQFYTPSQLPAENTSPTGRAIPDMIPLASVVNAEWYTAPPSLNRYNGYSAVQIVGSPAPGESSGDAMDTMENIVQEDLPDGFGLDWTGQSYQERISGQQAPLLFALSIVVVFLALAALYESWSIPVAVLLVVPLGVLGAVVFSLMRGLPNDVFFKIGLITIIGLAAKNAILIVEFAVEQQQAGKPLHKAVVEAARLRLRPVLMTSLAFILGVMPLALSTGAGANARHAIGTGVVGGMLFATFLGLLLIPLFYVAIRRLLGDKLDKPGHKHEDEPAESLPDG